MNQKHNFKIHKSQTFFNNLTGEPENLHPIKSTDTYSNTIQFYILESLLENNSDTYKWQSRLAKNWKQSPNGKIFTFEIYEDLKWSDGQNLTTKDIKFSFDAFKNPAYGGFRWLSYFENMESAKILSDTQIEFHVKEPYFYNFSIIATMSIIPEHIYKDPKLKMSKTLVGSGPYMLSHYIRGKILVLKKNPHWAGAKRLNNQKKWLFPAIAFRFVKEQADSLLRMEKEHLDFDELNAEAFLKKTNSAPWGTKIKKVKYSNKKPGSYSYIGFNLKKTLFQDLRVRKALAHLINRRLLNKKFNYNQKELATGPWYFWSDYADSTVLPIEFDPKQAKALLKSAGWRDQDQNGVLEKNLNGIKKEFSFTIIFAGKSSEKYLTIYQEDLKKAGIKLNLKTLDWTSFLRLLDDKNFDAVMLGWGGADVDHDPKQVWHSSSSQNKGSNYISYHNPQVDALIDKGRIQLNKADRIKIYKKIYRLIAKDVPYIFLFTSKKKFYGVNKRIENHRPARNYTKGMEDWNFKKLEE